MTQKVIHIHEAYNLSLRDREVIHEKESLSNIEKMLHMLKECVFVENLICIISHEKDHFIQDSIYYQII